MLTNLPRATGGVVFNDGRTFLFADGYVWQVRDDGELLVKFRSTEFQPNDRNREAPDAVKCVLSIPNRKQASA